MQLALHPYPDGLALVTRWQPAATTPEPCWPTTTPISSARASKTTS